MSLPHQTLAQALLDAIEETSSAYVDELSDGDLSDVIVDGHIEAPRVVRAWLAKIEMLGFKIVDEEAAPAP